MGTMTTSLLPSPDRICAHRDGWFVVIDETTVFVADDTVPAHMLTSEWLRPTHRGVAS